MVGQDCAWVALKMPFHPSEPQFTPLWDPVNVGTQNAVRIQVWPQEASGVCPACLETR